MKSRSFALKSNSERLTTELQLRNTIRARLEAWHPHHEIEIKQLIKCGMGWLVMFNTTHESVITHRNVTTIRVALWDGSKMLWDNICETYDND